MNFKTCIATIATILLIAALDSTSLPAHSQEAEPATAANAGEIVDTGDSTIIYPASFFAQYAPLTANDMLRRIPGISLALGGGGPGGGRGSRRGLGSGENQILINGKRVAGKANVGSDAIDRISADQVQHIEIIRGTSAQLDVRSAGPVINIVLKEGISQTTLSWGAEVRFYEDGTVKPGGSLAYSGEKGDLQYLASIEVEPRYENRIRSEFSVNPDGSPNDFVEESAVRKETDITLNGNVIYAMTAQDEVRLNALYEMEDPPTDRFRQVFDQDGELTSDIIEEIDATQNKWEIGGDYEHTFDGGSKYKVLFIVNDATDDFFREEFRIFDVDEGPGQSIHLDLAQRTRERIVRTSYKWGLAEAQDLEVGVEGAQTIFDSALEIGETAAETSLSVDKVDELRAEPFAVHNWQMNDKMSLETGVTLEFSKISQEGFENDNLINGEIVDPGETMFLDQSRSFFFVRPKIDWRYDVTNSFQIRATIERVINQLSFGNFVVNAEGNDDDQDTEEGNPDIVQEKSWDYELNLEYRLPNDGGVLNSRFFYSSLEDVIDRVEVPGDDIVSAAGNIGDGTKYGIDLDASIRFGFMGVPDLVVTAGLLWQQTSVTDPFLGTKRDLAFERELFGRVQIRHDIPEWNMNYGASYFQSGEAFLHDIDEFAEFKNDPGMNVFVEKVAFGGLTFKAEARNILDADRRRIRTRFDGHIADGIIEEIEDSSSGGGPTYILSVRGTF